MASTSEYKEFKQASDLVKKLERRLALVCMTADAPPLDPYRDTTIDAKMAAGGATLFLKFTGDELRLNHLSGLKKVTPMSIEYMKAWRYVYHQLVYLMGEGIMIEKLHPKFRLVVLKAIADSIYEADDDINENLVTLVSACSTIFSEELTLEGIIEGLTKSKA